LIPRAAGATSDPEHALTASGVARPDRPRRGR
jgi:hypothetical protein